MTRTGLVFHTVHEFQRRNRTRISANGVTLDGKYLYLAVNATIPSTEEAPFEVLISATNITDLNRTQVDRQEADRRKDGFDHHVVKPGDVNVLRELLR